MGHDLIKERQQWAVDLMQVKPRDRVLEIGCGRGVAAALVCEKLKDGRLLAIDRSTSMIAQALSRNKSYVETGKAEFLQTSFADFEWASQSFDKVFSFNVNLFWMKPEKDLKVLRQILGSKGQAFFFYTPPDAAQMKKIRKQLPLCLESHYFKVQETFEARFGSTSAFGVKALGLS